MFRILSVDGETNAVKVCFGDRDDINFTLTGVDFNVIKEDTFEHYRNIMYRKIINELEESNSVLEAVSKLPSFWVDRISPEEIKEAKRRYVAAEEKLNYFLEYSAKYKQEMCKVNNQKKEDAQKSRKFEQTNYFDLIKDILEIVG